MRLEVVARISKYMIDLEWIPVALSSPGSIHHDSIYVSRQEIEGKGRNILDAVFTVITCSIVARSPSDNMARPSL